MDLLVAARMDNDMTLRLVQDKIYIQFPYRADLVAFVQQLPGRTWDKMSQSWVIPVDSGHAVLADLSRVGFPIPVDVRVAVQEAHDKREVLRVLQHQDNCDFDSPLPLYAFQRVVAQYMVYSGACLNACGVGLGKTITTLAAVHALKADRILIVVPKSLLYQWANEIQKWFPEAVVAVVQGRADKRQEMYVELQTAHADCMVIGYDTLRVDIDKIPHEWDAIICDEAHRLGNRTAQTYKALKKLQSKHRFALTATPLMNKVQDFYGIVDWLKPGHLGSWMRFQDRYCIKDRWGGVVGTRNIDELRSKLLPVMIRKTLEEVQLQLPPLTETELPVVLSEKERKLYKQIQQELLFQLSKEDVSKLSTPMILQHALVKLGKLQELVDSLELLGDSHDSSKLDALKEHLHDVTLSGGKAIIFTRFTRMADILVRELAEYKPALITGSITGKDREDAVETFMQVEDCRLLVSTDAGGAGLNLQAATVVYNYDLPWSVGKYIQRTGRAHRIGQDKPVLVVNLIVQKSVDQHVWKQLRAKSRLSDQMLETPMFESMEDISAVLTDQ